jgi:hypothetical protein
MLPIVDELHQLADQLIISTFLTLSRSAASYEDPTHANGHATEHILVATRLPTMQLLSLLTCMSAQGLSGSPFLKMPLFSNVRAWLPACSKTHKLDSAVLSDDTISNQFRTSETINSGPNRADINFPTRALQLSSMAVHQLLFNPWQICCLLMPKYHPTIPPTNTHSHNTFSLHKSSCTANQHPSKHHTSVPVPSINPSTINPLHEDVQDALQVPCSRLL